MSLIKLEGVGGREKGGRTEREREREREGGGGGGGEETLSLTLCSVLSFTYFFHLSSNIGADEMLYSEKDLEKSMDKIETINFHQVGYICYIL